MSILFNFKIVSMSGYVVLLRLMERDKYLTDVTPVFSVGYADLCPWSSLMLPWISADLYVDFGLYWDFKCNPN